MEDNKKSDHQQLPESPGSDATASNGEEIIDLTEIVAKGELEPSLVPSQAPPPADDGEEIIELTDIVAPQAMEADTAAQAAEPALDEEDQIIELTDIAAPQAMEADTAAQAAEPALDEEDQIIELADIVQPEIPEEEAMPTPASLVSDVQEPLETADADARLISGQLPDSNEYFQKQRQNLEDTLSELESMMDDTFSGEEGLIEMDDVLNDGQVPSDDQVFADASDQEYDDFPIGIALDEAAGDELSGDELPEQQPPSLTEEQIDAAIERLIRAKYGQSIEQFIAASIEKIVTKHIETLRQSMLEDDGPID